jgi:hypothetical protein
MGMDVSAVLNGRRIPAAVSLLSRRRPFSSGREDRSSCPVADIVPCSAHLWFSLPAHVVAILVQNQVGDLASRIPEEFHLGIEDFREELALRFRERSEIFSV